MTQRSEQLEKLLAAYRQLTRWCDGFFAKVQAQLPHDTIRCAEGCWKCCELTSVCALEAFVIVAHLRHTRPQAPCPVDDQRYCPFLAEGSCGIYAARPIICRTHGLAIVSSLDEAGRVHHCEYNFTSIAAHALPTELLLDEQVPATNLARLNIAFCMLVGDTALADNRIDLRDLASTALPRFLVEALQAVEEQ